MKSNRLPWATLAIFVGASVLGCTPKPSRDHVDAAPSASAPATSTHRDAADHNQGNSAMKLTSTAFQNHGDIPRKYTCQGEDISPPLSWSGAPERTKSFALIVDDPDAPDPKAPKMTWVHWVVFGIPSSTTSLPEHVSDPPPGAKSGLNDWKRTGYGGPCPPIGKHRYFFKLYALDIPITELNPPTKKQLEAAMKGHILAEAQLVGLYEKK